MRVQKRDGEFEDVSFDKVLQRIRKASRGRAVNPDILAQQVLARIIDGIKTSELDILAAQMAASLSTTHPDWGYLASQIAVSNHQKNTPAAFSEVVRILSNQTAPKTGKSLTYLSQEILDIMSGPLGAQVDAYIKPERDYEFDYFGFKTLEKSYLLRDANKVVIERPQHMWMRVSLALWGTDLERAFETYDLLSQKVLTHATPTLFNAGTPRQQLSSCFLLAMKEDSIAGIYDTLKDCALISKHAGGIGLSIHDIRARGALIEGTNGTSNGLVPMLRNFNATARYVDQCFTPDTIIYTEAGPKPIEEVSVSDKVLTSGGMRNVLKNVIHEINGPMIEVKMDTGVVIRVTDIHPILGVKSKGRNANDTISAMKAGLLEADYIDVKDLDTGDLLIDKGKFNTIVSMKEIQYSGRVHDFEIEAPHDYYIPGFGFAHNGGGRRNGSFAVYLEPWHADVEDFLRLKLNTGSEEDRARDLFYALWISDLFMRRVEADEKWSLFCPSEAPGLADVYGAEFDALYTGYEAKGLARKVVDARTLWYQILETQMETGTPYLLYKDPANQKSNQKNLGTIRSSNLCTEIIEYSAPDETAVCNLASIALPAFVGPFAAGFPSFNFGALRKAVSVAIRNLNRVIDINYYPTPETKKSNMRHRPVGLGVQGLADVFAMLQLSWESPAAADLNQRIFEHLYYAAAETSAAIAAEEGSYETFAGSPTSKGILQPDLWGVTPLTEKSGELDWPRLRLKAAAGMRNSLLVAPMPTASTSQILGYTECFEPFTSNMYTRRVLAGEFTVINKYLVKELLGLGLWTEGMKQAIVMRKGSVQGIPTIPEEVQARYKTAWEIPQKTLIDMAAARGAFICQSQSLNLFVADPTISRLTSMHFYAWKTGLKTGCYYLRTKAPVAAQQFTVDPRLLAALEHQSTMSTAVLPDEAYDTDSDEEAASPVAVVMQETRQQKLERLSKEYEEEVKRAKEAADAGEGCLFCSS
jgi:ribonucleoside-diphosphate reductase alpha subunit